MKYRSVLLSRKWCLVLFAAVLLGCASREVIIRDHKNEFMARPLSELKLEIKQPGSYASKIGWKERTYSLANGNYVYVEPMRQDCDMHWEINPEGTIVGAQPKGYGCGETSTGPANMSELKTTEQY